MQATKSWGKVLVMGLAMGWTLTAVADPGVVAAKSAKTTKEARAAAAVKSAKNDWAVCPVEKTKILKSRAVDTAVYQGKTYYFCCAGCKPAFIKDPAKYLK